MKKDRAYLKHILDAISDVEKFTKDVTKKEFFGYKEKQYAVLKTTPQIFSQTDIISS